MKQIPLIICLSILSSLFLIAYLIVWFSGEFDESQYIDTYRVFVSFGLALSFCTLKMEVKYRDSEDQTDNS